MHFSLKFIATLAFVTLLSPVLSKPTEQAVANGEVASKEISEKFFTGFGSNVVYQYVPEWGTCLANGLQIVNYNGVNCAFHNSFCYRVPGGCSNAGVIYPNVNGYMNYFHSPLQNVGGWNLYNGPNQWAFFSGSGTLGAFPVNRLGSFGSSTFLSFHRRFW
ncbi:secreted protein [Melampsora americana]|nr:secreted protein [Melampsora americana]